MPTTDRAAAEQAMGRAPDELTLPQRQALAGSWIALEIYTPRTIPLRRIEAIGGSVEECAAVLRRRGLDPANFEFTILKPPY